MSVPAERWEGAGNVYLLIDAEHLSIPLDPDRVRTVCAILKSDGVLDREQRHPGVSECRGGARTGTRASQSSVLFMDTLD